MRIVGGLHRGRKFRAPSNIPARPTTDFAKEGLFNILDSQIDWDDCRVLDLFAGIGSISIECISRGAEHVVAVDKDHRSITWIKRLAIEVGVSNLEVLKGDALNVISSLEMKSDLVFADPPYEFKDYERLISLVLSSALKQDAIFVLEHRKTGDFKDHPNFVKDRSYGEVKFSFFNNTL
ncbi:MAG: RsmD family RNA methyltransferase [Flavobacteriales bacterium]|nr:RsmD family RNA methyltransferase [Flavobacteriales bacterium]